MATVSTSMIPNEILTIYSRVAILAAEPIYAFRRFVDYRMEANVEPGNTIQFLKLNNINDGVQMTEFDLMTEQPVSDSVVQITMGEWGTAIKFTRFASRSSFRDLLQDAAVRLGRSYASTLDAYLRDAYLSTANIQYAGGGVNDAAITSSHVFNTKEIKDGVEFLQTIKAPMIYRGNDKFYMCVAHPRQIRSLMDDPAWINAHQYTDPSNLFFGEAGRYHNVVFISTTQMPVSTGTGSGSIDVYSAVMFGEKVVGFGESLPMELVEKEPADYKRFFGIGWYSIHGAGIINDYAIEIRTA